MTVLLHNPPDSARATAADQGSAAEFVRLQQDPIDSQGSATAQDIVREQWLHRFVDEFCRPLFQKRGYSIPRNLRLTCGWPATGGLSPKKRTLSELWHSNESADGTYEILVSPSLDDPYQVAEALIKQLVYLVGSQVKARKRFYRVAVAVDLTGSTTTATLSEALLRRLQEFFDPPDPFPAYPHARIDASQREKQRTRMLKAFCQMCNERPRAEHYIIRLSKQVANLGLPECPVCRTRLKLEDQKEEERAPNGSTKYVIRA